MSSKDYANRRIDTIIRGDTNVTYTGSLYDGDTDPNHESPLDLNGYTFKFTAKKALDDPDSEAVASDIDTITTSRTQFNLNPSCNVTGNFFADIQVETPDGKIQTVDYFLIHVVGDVTQNA